MIRVAICDDNEYDLSRLRDMLENCGMSLSITDYASGENLLWDIETERARFDIFLLDIYLEERSGVEIARRIRALDKRAVLIFVTVSQAFYQAAFDVYALYYLVKPVEQAALNALMERATEGVERAMEGIERERKQVLSIVSRGRPCVLRYEDVEYIASANRTLCFHLHGGGERTCYGKLDQMADQLKTGSFVRCHQSYMVNLRYVQDRVPGGFRMSGTVVPVSRSYADAAQAAMNQYLFGAFEQN